MEVAVFNGLTGGSRTALDDIAVDSILLVLEKPHVSPCPIEASSFRLLNSIDPHGVTLFNRYQMTFFLEEWKQLEPTLDPKERDGWSKVRDAAEYVARTPDTFLKLVGD